ncbi:MAG TPA: aminotransferase class V-fold PLP-dependent enzyme [Gemmatimonadaceae bacterium]
MPSLSRREFARFLAVSGSASLLPAPALAESGFSFERWGLRSEPLPRTPISPDEKFWKDVRARFLVPPDVGFLNAANLCPMSLPVIEAIEKTTRSYEMNPSPEAKSALIHVREDARTMIAEALRVTPEEIVLTRNTTEGNNFVSSGLTLGHGDEVIVVSDNHPSNLNAWRQKGTRFGFTVVTVEAPAAHPGAAGYVELLSKAITPRTKVLAIQVVSSNSGDLLPVAELCRVAREHGVLSLLDGAQAFGVLDLNLKEINPDFFTGSIHKWPCGPKEKGILYINKTAQDKIAPTIYGVYAGAVGVSRSFEGEGQRDDASMAAVVEALKFQAGIGRSVIEQRSRALAAHAMTELAKLDGVHLWTNPAPDRSAAIVIFKPGSLDPRKFGDALSQKEKIVTTVRGANGVNPGLRISPHFFNTMDDIDRLVDATRRYLKTGV